MQPGLRPQMWASHGLSSQVLPLGSHQAAGACATMLMDVFFPNQVGGNPNVQPITLPAQAGGASP